MSKTIVVDDLFQKDFQEYKKEYAIWVETRNSMKLDDEFNEIPADDILLSLALAKATEVMKTLNEYNKKRNLNA